MAEQPRLKFKVRCPHCNQMFIVNAPMEEAIKTEPVVPPRPAASPPSPPSPPPPSAAPRPPAPEPLEEERELTPEEEDFRDRIVKAILARDFELPMLPHVALKVIRLSSDPDASMQDLAKVILTDQTIAAKILQIANSPVYAAITEISNINQALVRLGQAEVKNLMLAISLGTKIFKSRLYGRLAKTLWEKAVGVAFAARVLATKLNADRDESFLCGLMHNIGRMIALSILEKAQHEVGSDFRPPESMAIGILDQYHRDIGELTVAKWALPPVVGTVIAHFETPQNQTTPQRVVSVISLADAFCRQAGIGLATPEEIDLASHPATRLLRLEPALGKEMFDRFVQIFASAKNEFL